MRALSFALLGAALLALSACREAADEGPKPLANPLAEATEACHRGGGQMMKAPGLASAQICVRETKDFGKQCTGPRDCEGDCLARSGSCAPATPLFGCHEIFMQPGQRATLCRD